MKTTVVVALVAGLAAGAAGSLLTRSVLSESAPAAPAAVGPGASLEALSAQVGGLDQKLGALDERLDALELQARLVADRREAAGAEAERLESAQTDAHAEKLAAALAESGADLPPEFQKTVRNALQQIREQEEKERADRRREQLEQRLDERIAELALELGLTRNQQDDLRNLYLDTDTRRNELFQSMREGGGDWGSMRDQMRELRDGVEQQLAKTLSPDQLEKFKETDTGRMLYGPGGGGPGGAGGFGGFGGNRRNRNTNGEPAGG